MLRKHRFRIKESVSELGLSHKFRTLSNHLRGICIQSLANNSWDEHAVALEAAGSDDPSTVANIRSKIHRYLENIRNSVARGDERRLYNNLPSTYHSSLNAALDRFRKDG